MDRAILTLLAPLAAVGCMTVRPVVTPATYIPQQKPELVWVTQASGEVIPVAGPTVQGDTLVGSWLGTSERVSVALPRVQAIYARQPDRKRTTMLVAFAGVATGFLVWRAIQAGNGASNCFYVPGPGWTECT